MTILCTCATQCLPQHPSPAPPARCPGGFRRAELACCLKVRVPLVQLFPNENCRTTWLLLKGLWAALPASILAAVRFWARPQRPKEKYMSPKACRPSPSSSCGSSVASIHLVGSRSTLVTADLQHKQRCGGNGYSNNDWMNNNRSILSE